eukprot:g37365.t1
MGTSCMRPLSIDIGIWHLPTPHNHPGTLLMHCLGALEEQTCVARFLGNSTVVKGFIDAPSEAAVLCSSEIEEAASREAWSFPMEMVKMLVASASHKREK